jgi:predicted nucleic acid-binding Zn ribbon protein
MFEPFQKFMTKAANRYGVGKEIQAIEVCHNFSQFVPVLFHDKETPEKYIKPAYFKKDILVIEVESPAWAQEIIMRKPQIIDEMNKKAGRQIIKSLRTQLR